MATDQRERLNESSRFGKAHPIQGRIRRRGYSIIDDILDLDALPSVGTEPLAGGPAEKAVKAVLDRAREKTPPT